MFVPLNRTHLEWASFEVVTLALLFFGKDNNGMLQYLHSSKIVILSVLVLRDDT